MIAVLRCRTRKHSPETKPNVQIVRDFGAGDVDAVIRSIMQSFLDELALTVVNNIQPVTH